MRKKLLLCIVLTGGLGLVARASAAEPTGVILKSNGRVVQNIIYSGDENSSARFAAEELQKYLRLSLGVKLPIVSAAQNVAGPAFVVGKNAVTDRLGLDMAKLPKEGFYLKTSGDYIIIAGDDHPLLTYKEMKEGYWHPGFDRDAATRIGTLFGVYTFLKKVVGVDWYFAGPLGEVAPKNTALTVPELDFTVGPSFQQRKIGLGNDHTGTTELPIPEFPDSKFLVNHIWGFRGRLGFSWACVGSHGMWFWGQLFGKEHPEYFSLVDKERTNDWGWTGQNRAGANRDFCWASRPTIQRQIEEMRLFYGGEIKRHMWIWTYSDINYYPIGANDGTMRNCECPECTKWYYTDEKGVRKVQDAYWYHVAEVAKVARKEFPGKFIVALAYGSGNRLYPPRKITLPDNVRIARAGVAPAMLADPKAAADWEQLLGEWRSKAKICWMYTDAFRRPLPHLPLVMPHVVAKEIKARAGQTDGFYFCGGETETGPYTQPEYYVAAELMWDVRQNTEELLDDFYRGLYGPASGPVKACYTYLEDVWLQEYPRYSGTHNRSLELKEIAWRKIFTPERIVKALGFIDQAYACVEKYSPEWNRISRCEAQLLQTLGYSLQETLKSKVDVEAAERQPARKVATVGRPPVLDGRLTEAAWKRPPDGIMVKVADGAAAEAATSVWLARDDRNLYVAVKCGEPFMDKLAAKVTPSPESLTATIFGANDDVEFFFDTTNSCQVYHQLAVDAAGQTWSAGPKGSDVKDVLFTHAVGRSSDGWSVELAVPFSSLGGPPPAGTRWGVNVTRTRQPKESEKKAVYYAWFPSGTFHAPARYGRIEF